MYDLKEQVLKVYHFGKLMFSVSSDEYEKYEFIFGNYNELLFYKIYDSKKMSYNFERDSEVRELLAHASIGTLEKWYEAALVKRPEIEDIRCRANSSSAYPMYRKRFTVSGVNNRSVDFFVERVSIDNDTWRVAVHLPYKYVFLKGEYKGEEKAVEQIRKIVRSEGVDSLVRFAEISDMLLSFYTTNRWEDLKIILNALCAMWDNGKWYIPDGCFTVDEIVGHYGELLNAS